MLKLWRSKKAITPVLSNVLLLVIAVSLWFWFLVLTRRTRASDHIKVKGIQPLIRTFSARREAPEKGAGGGKVFGVGVME